ncbi:MULTISPECIES: 3-hydroxyacyl-ACP dehydratase FabZ family protein [unclassified Saccharothrix]|uniref:3-hydroxyacyl-ACP dehydratase FabZ family protein n=1 Tax=unclassified Saccharothrix TaxID=2593673 RepID=UPI00307D79FC
MLEHHRLKALLPHRHPMLQVDRVLEVDPGRRIVAVKAVTATEPCYADLPDDAPHAAHAYPVSLLLESLGQAGALLWALSTEHDDATPLLGAVRDFAVHGAAYPGDVLRHEVHLDHATPDRALLRGETRVDGRLIATVPLVLGLAVTTTTT